MDGLEVDHRKLEAICKEILVSVGVPTEEASIITHSLIEANLRGVDSHGILRLPAYVQRIQKGLVKARSSFKVLNDTATTAVIDGEYSMGQVLGVKAMDLAIEKAEQANVGIVAVRNSHHFGTAGYYALRPAVAGMIGICLSNTVPLMPVPGGASKAVGNNPLAIAVPTGLNSPFVLDMAMSVVALGKLLVAKNLGKDIPIDWATDKNGIPTKDPNQALNGGFLLPVGGHKGYGLALMIDILAGVLSGSAYGKQVKSLFVDQPVSIGHLMIAIKVSAFIPEDEFRSRVTSLIQEIKSGPRVEEIDELLLPGEIEYREQQKRLTEGIPLSPKVVKELQELAQSLGIEGLL